MSDSVAAGAEDTGSVNTTDGVKVPEEKLMNGKPLTREPLDKEAIKADAVAKVKAAFSKLGV